MEVTTQNFQEQLGVLKAAVEAASFVAIDCEFTGLQFEKCTHAFDTPEERYRKLRESSQDFLTVQVGVCTFQFDKAKHGYKYKAFNFYICPRQTVRGAPDRMFRCQASSLQFLSQHGFDFNKLFRQGISYLKSEEVSQLSQALGERHAQQLKDVGSTNGPAKSSKVGVPKEAQGFIDEVLESVGKFLDGAPSAASGMEIEMDEDVEEEPEAAKDSSAEDGAAKGGSGILHLPECNAFKRKLIYQEVKARFGDKVQLGTETCGDGAHIAVRLASSTDEQRAQLELKHKQERKDLEMARGFGKVLELLAANGKLVVGHNMLLDIMHLLSQFVEDVPKEYNEFKSMVRAAFPNLIDTKVLASDSAIKDSFTSTALGLLLKQLQGRPSCVPPVEHDPDYGYDLNSAKFHEAGYDALVTGMCFLGLCHELGKSKDHTVELQASSPILKPYLNRVYMMFSPDIPSLNMAGNEVIPSRSHVLHVTFPSEWRANDLYQLFCSFGQITIHWINCTQAFVAMASSSLATQALKKLGGKASSHDHYRLQSYTSYMTRSSRAPASAAGTTATAAALPSPPPVAPTRTKTPSSGDAIPPVEEDLSTARKRKRSASLSSSVPSFAPLEPKDEIDEPKQKLVKKTTKELTVTEKLFEENDDWS
uniref:Putative polya-specific ribonuclease parn n=1 Tax=Amblyomma aureolatum TaxID=187763 RepID=A0A1E1XGM9_9ACAR